MNQATCPICNTPNQKINTACINCGAIIPISQAPDFNQTKQHINYTNRYGETDLFEATPRRRQKNFNLTTFIIILVITLTAIILITQPNATPTITTTELTGSANPNSLNFITNTHQPTLALATTTPGPPTSSHTPTPTASPTQGPCTQQVQAGDSLIALAARCGHQSLDVIQVILELNDLTDPNQIQIGQTLQIPWPTATPSQELIEDATLDNNSDSQMTATPDQSTRSSRLNPPTETLQPGVTWHRITKDESIITIAIQYGATLRILSELNPEVAFSQCDFGLGSGGPNCIVQIFEGQLIRVPAPTPTPTIQPTLSGSETPAPTATPTFNAPSALSPQPGALFSPDVIVTLRWTTTGTLSENQSYRVTVQNRVTGEIHTATTRELSFIIPALWQPQTNERQEYTWTIAVVDSADQNKPQFETEPRQFIWQGRRTNE